MNDYSTPNRNQWTSSSSTHHQAGASISPSNNAPNSAKYTAPTSFNNYTVPNVKWAAPHPHPHTNSGANTPTNPSALTTAFPSFNGGIPPLYPSISAQSSSSIQGHHGPHGQGGVGRTLDKTISASSSTNSLHNLTAGISKLSVAAPGVSAYNPYNFNPYDIPTPSATTPNVGGLHSNGATPTGFKFNNFSYSNIATPTTPLNPNVTKMAYPLHHTAAMNNIYAMHNAMATATATATATLPAATVQLSSHPQQINTKLNSNAAPYQPMPAAPNSTSTSTHIQKQQLEHQKSAERVPYSYPSYAEAANTAKDAKKELTKKDDEDEKEKEEKEKEEEEEIDNQKQTDEAIQKLNPATWPSNPRYAKFYVIKSFGEDDVHKSIKYNLWCSTERGNRKLDEAFNESKRVNAANIVNDNQICDDDEEKDKQKKEIDSRDTVRGCPVYMFFSVNRSGCFCGMAQMISNYYKERHFGSWVQDGKWQGSFIVKWIYVKDIPNKDLKDIQLPNNDSRPVTFSRDTQEIPFAQGIEMLRRFIKYEPKTNILQDFKYYDDRERDIKQKRTQQIILQRMSNDHHPQRLIDNQQPQQQPHQHGSYGYRGRGRGGGRGGYNSQSNGYNQRRRYYSKNERNNDHSNNNGYHHHNHHQNHSNGYDNNSYRHQRDNSYRNHSSNGGNYGNYQILKRNENVNRPNSPNKGSSHSDNGSDNGSNRSRYNNRAHAKNRWVPK